MVGGSTAPVPERRAENLQPGPRQGTIQKPVVEADGGKGRQFRYEPAWPLVITLETQAPVALAQRIVRSRLVADDRVDVYAKDEETLWGEPAEILRHLLEIRGVGIIDVMSLYGASAVRNSSQVQLGIYLENFENGKVFDRLGNSNEEIELQGVKIPRIRIPVKTGRNVSVVIEAAAMNYRAKQMGFDATKTFNDRLTNLISKNGEE